MNVGNGGCRVEAVGELLQNLETALAGGLGQMSLVNDYQVFQPNLGSSSVVEVWRSFLLGHS